MRVVCRGVGKSCSAMNSTLPVRGKGMSGARIVGASKANEIQGLHGYLSPIC